MQKEEGCLLDQSEANVIYHAARTRKRKVNDTPIAPPNSFPWPPVLAVGFLLAGLLSRLVIEDLRIGPAQLVVGTSLLLVGGLMIAAAFLAFIQHRSNIMPHKPAGSLITSGVFRLSRNPIYTGEVIAILGLGIALGSIGLVAVAILLALTVRQVGILREERHMAARFGAAWEQYCAKTRRWL
jgi:protein-S-isoprenylcysteine O-methyltransferase Ste14